MLEVNRAHAGDKRNRRKSDTSGPVDRKWAISIELSAFDARNINSASPSAFPLDPLIQTRIDNPSRVSVIKETSSFNERMIWQLPIFIRSITSTRLFSPSPVPIPFDLADLIYGRSMAIIRTDLSRADLQLYPRNSGGMESWDATVGNTKCNYHPICVRASYSATRFLLDQV